LVNTDFSEASSASLFREGKRLFLLCFIKKSDDGQRPKKQKIMSVSRVPSLGLYRVELKLAGYIGTAVLCFSGMFTGAG
jgi:hypothetical protein